MNRNLLIYILLAFCLNLSYSQETIDDLSKKQKKWYQESARKAKASKYTDAVKLCEKILKDQPNNVDVHLRKASFLYNNKNRSGALETFATVVALAPSYDSLVYFSIGLIHYELGEYDQASNNLGLFLASSKGRKKKRARAKKMKSIADFTAEAMKNPVPFNPIRLPEFINNEKLQYLPALTADGNTLLYTERDGGFEDLFISHLTSKGNYGPGVLFTDITMPQGVAAHCIAPDGKTIIVTSNDRNQGFGSCDLFISNLKNGKWSRARNLGPDINSATWDSQPSLSADGRTLYFSSKRRNGMGGSDIYTTTKDKNGRWGIPKNLGNIINTAGDDESPFIHPDGNTLYFRSTGHPGMGNFDIFIARRDLKTQQWGKPKNIGYPINTVANDGALFVSIDGTKAYYTSDRYSLENNIKPNLDLYEFDLDPSIRPDAVSYVKGKVIDAFTKKGIKAKIEITATDYARQIKSDAQGEFMITLPVGKNYAINVNKEEYLFHSERFELEGTFTSIDPLKLNISLFQIPPKIVPVLEEDPFVYDTPIVMHNILFSSGSAELLPISDKEISQLAELLKQNTHFKIKIMGHTDNVGDDKSNLQLSKDRAEAVYRSLISKGVPAENLLFEGFGEAQPIADNTTEEGKKLNRRTEFILIKNN